MLILLSRTAVIEVSGVDAANVAVSAAAASAENVCCCCR
jgi:hypothetical protein